jgi:hypothetical protein
LIFYITDNLNLSLQFFENKTVGRLEKCSTVDLLQIFKKRSSVIRHLGSRRHFGLFQKSSSMICSYLKAEQKV